MTAPGPTVARECVEGYLYRAPPVELLIFRRPPGRGGFWVPISGKVDPGDADLEAALRRELLEETGLARPRRVLPLDWSVTFPVESGATWRLHAFAVEVEPGFEPRLSDEHDAWAWVSAAEAAGRLHFEDNRAAVGRLLERVGPAPPPNV
ncbi:MAG TPA: NUDIX domain-containing protein [Thermoplasmata archaeon]|nr:NUDIX domain-containing protein [Thermoplasmata archaeon]